MDYAPNGTLHQRHLRGNALSLASVLPYVRQVAVALQYAHNRRLIVSHKIESDAPLLRRVLWGRVKQTCGARWHLTARYRQ